MQPHHVITYFILNIKLFFILFLYSYFDYLFKCLTKIEVSGPSWCEKTYFLLRNLKLQKLQLFLKRILNVISKINKTLRRLYLNSLTLSVCNDDRKNLQLELNVINKINLLWITSVMKPIDVKQ